MDGLAALTAALAAHVAQERGWSRAQATRWVARHMQEARDEYRAKGAPLGDTDECFMIWLTPRPQPPTA